MATKTGTIRPIQRRFVERLAEGESIAQAGKSVGVSRRTAYRWAGDPRVRVALSALQDAALSDVARRLQAGARTMLDVLERVAADCSEPASVRLRAALGWLDLSFRATELLDLAQRLEELEERFADER
jgi:Flp pilus assembly protein TadB